LKKNEMTLICTYPLSGSTLVYRAIKTAVMEATGDSQREWPSEWSGQWAMTVSGLDETEEVHFKLLVVDHCTVKKV